MWFTFGNTFTFHLTKKCTLHVEQIILSMFVYMSREVTSQTFSVWKIRLHFHCVPMLFERFSVPTFFIQDIPGVYYFVDICFSNSPSRF